MAGVVAARGPGHRGTPVAALSLGIARARLRSGSTACGSPARKSRRRAARRIACACLRALATLGWRSRGEAPTLESRTARRHHGVPRRWHWPRTGDRCRHGCSRRWRYRQACACCSPTAAARLRRVGVRLIISLLAIALLYLQFRTFNGLSAGTALLALMAGLKLLETDTQRDIYVVTLLIYFVCVAALLEGDSFWLLAYLIGVCWLTTATLLRLTTTQPAPRLAAQPALCRTAAGSGPASGLGILAALSTLRRASVADPGKCATRRIRIERQHEPRRHHRTRAIRRSRIPRALHGGRAAAARSATGGVPCMHDFDGHTWRRGYSASLRAPAVQPQGAAAYTYTLSLEPHQHNWIFALGLADALEFAAGRAQERLHAGTAATRVPADRHRAHLGLRAAIGADIERFDAPQRPAPAAASQSAHAATGARAARRERRRRRVYPRRSRHVLAAGLLLHVDAAQARRRLRSMPFCSTANAVSAATMPPPLRC